MNNQAGHASGARVPTILEAVGIEKTYKIDSTTIPVLRGVSFTVEAGKTMSITGASGAGKSTLLHILGGLDQPSNGKVLFAGMDLYSLSGSKRADIRARRVGFVFQSYHLLPELDIQENVMLPAMSQWGALRSISRHRQRALELLECVGLGQRAGHRPAELSGGEQQRAALARSLMNEPEIVFADEPTGNLDSQTGQQVLEYLFKLTRDRGHTLIVVTHNDAVARLCDRQMVLKDGCLAS
ncbi:MAG: ABC transporter ATP-binding protein [Lentisphaerota bacterium]